MISPTIDDAGKPTYEQFSAEWLDEFNYDGLSPFEKGLRFGVKLVTQWLDVTTDDDDLVVCDGAGDGGIDIAYLQRADTDTDSRGNEADAALGDTWYLIQSKYGSAFTGSETIMEEGDKTIRTLLGQNEHLSDTTVQLLQKLSTFRSQASDADRLVLVFATTDPVTPVDRDALENIQLIGRQRVMKNFDVEEVSLLTIWENLDDVELPKLSVPVAGKFVEQYSGLLVGTISLLNLFEFLKSYKSKTGNLDQLYERNVRQFLGNRRKINKGIANTLNATPEKFGLYNNGITIVVSGYSKQYGDDAYVVHDPYIVNGCQTTRTIWQVLDNKLNAGGTGTDTATLSWTERATRGGVVTKIVSSDEAEITNITRFTNSQNAVREQDFIALHSGFQAWAKGMEEHGLYLEIQRGGIESRKAWEKQHPDEPSFNDYVNAFNLVKVFGAGWLNSPGPAFGKNAPFLPKGSIYERMVSRPDAEPAFGVRDLYAAYKVKCAADAIGFGRTANQPSRRQSRYLFYHIVLRMLGNVVLLTPEFRRPPVSEAVLTEAVLRLSVPGAEAEFNMLLKAATTLVDLYLTHGSGSSAHDEESFNSIHNGDLNAFLKAEHLGKDEHSPLLVQLLAQHNLGFASMPMPMFEGNPTQREFVAQALMRE